MRFERGKVVGLQRLTPIRGRKLNYVNAMCRCGATFTKINPDKGTETLPLDETISSAFAVYKD